MREKPAVDWTPSVLHQAGEDTVEFNSATISIFELAGVSAVRVHSMDQLQATGGGLPALPAETGQTAGDNPAVLCLRPREWLFLSETFGPDELLGRVKEGIEPRHTTILDASDGLGLLRLTGDGAPWLLAKISCLDFLAGTAAGAHCARTRMGHVPVIVHYHPDAAGDFVFDLVFDRSVACYLWNLLRESAPHADDLFHAHGVAA
jgi:heterotetrameric sarcosine oxidase gamma subunit